MKLLKFFASLVLVVATVGATGSVNISSQKEINSSVSTTVISTTSVLKDIATSTIHSPHNLNNASLNNSATETISKLNITVPNTSSVKFSNKTADNITITATTSSPMHTNLSITQLPNSTSHFTQSTIMTSASVDLTHNNTSTNHSTIPVSPTNPVTIRPNVSSPNQTSSTLKLPPSTNSVSTTQVPTFSNNQSTDGILIQPVPTKKTTSPGVGIALGVTSAIIIIVLVVLVYKYQRRFIRAFRFRRLQEVPMDDFDDEGRADTVYSDHTVPINFR